jgi:hypothetical protein
MDKIIKFATNEKYLVYPQSAQKLVPEWYRKAERFLGGKQIFAANGAEGRPTVKICVPFLDALTTGYIIELWQDLQVTIVNNQPVFNWLTGPEVLEERPIELLQGLPLGAEYYQKSYAWKSPFFIQTPKNYSVLITHPLNYYDLPFTTTSGIVDSDFVVGDGNIPFLFKKQFEGIIPKGTPIAQIIPFKRDNWKSKIDKEIILKYEYHRFNMRRVASGWYKKNMWKRKSYN